MVKVLFVCLGNICRSPMAEAVFQEMVNKAGLADEIAVDSAGTGAWHVGEKAHRGTQTVLAKHGIVYNGRARQINKNDMTIPNSYIITMDDNNLSDLQSRFGHHPRLSCLLDFARGTKERNIPDPYYTGNFQYVYELVTDGCRGLLADIRQQQNI